MFPPARASTPSPRSRGTASAVVVLLPLVPVMQTTRVGSASAMNKPSPPQTLTPASLSCATSGRERLMPGLFTTTSQERRASIPPAPVARISRPSSDAAPGASSTSTGSRPMDRSRRMLACPSTPSPQTPTDASASADQEIGWRITIRDAMGAARLQQRAGIGRYGVAQFGPQSGQELCSGAVLALRGEDESAPAFVDVPHTFERLGA